MSVYKQRDRWIAQIYDPKLGRKVHVGSFKTKGEANRAFEEAKAGAQKSRITVREWREQWITQNTDWKESTRIVNKQRTDLFVATYGDIRLVDITRNQARAWAKDRPSEFAGLRAMFSAAMYEDDEHGGPLLVHNPFSRIVRSTRAKRDLEPDWLTEADIEKLEAAAIASHDAFGQNFAAMIRFAAETGLRPGEIFALRLEDLHPDKGLVVVRRAVDSRTRMETLPKNGKARMVVMSDLAYAATEIVERPKGCDRVFPSARGGQFHNTLLLYYWNPVRNRIDRPKMAFYELRHYCATKLLEAGLSDSDVAVQLGHTDGGTLVRRVYGHPNDRTARDRIREAMERKETEDDA